MSRRYSYLITCLLLLVISPVQADQGIWQEIQSAQRQLATDTGANRYFQANHLVLKDLLDAAPDELSGDKSHLIELPMPDGSLARFAVVESPILDAVQAAQYPQFRTYKAYGIDEPGATGRLSYTPKGFGGMLRTAKDRFFIDSDGQVDRYVMRSRSEGSSLEPFQCAAFKEGDISRQAFESPDIAAFAAQRLPGSLLTYRLAVAATNEYYLFAEAQSDTANEIFIAVNRINEIYERDHGIRFLPILNTALYENPNTSQLTNNIGSFLIDEVQGWIDGKIANGSYDIGHIFSTGGGGLAFIGSACDNSNKAKGVTGLSSPTGDPFYIDFVAHELGHQLNADHTFNGTSGSCTDGFAGNRNQATAYEPGSGSTIMAYAGICGAENLQGLSETTFHAGSIAQIDAFSNAAGNCRATLATTPANNQDPVIGSVIADRSIPIKTPFQLLGSATDIESGVNLLYQWDQMNAGSSTDANSFGTDRSDNALFRSYAPRTTGLRDFPALGTQVRGLYDKAEVLPCHTRNIDLRLTVRDDDSGQAVDNVRLSAHAGAGPFRVTNFNSSPQAPIIASGPAIIVTWEVAKTDLAPVSCSSVNIDLLTFSAGYAQYSVHRLKTNTANTAGSALVNFPQPTLSHPRARLRVICSDNYFYDINNIDLAITGSDPTPLFYSDNTINTASFKTAAITSNAAPACGSPDNFTPRPDSGAIDWRWLMLLAGLAVLGRRLRFRAGSWS